MPRAPRGNCKFVRPNRFALFKKDRDRNVRRRARSIENAARLMAHHRWGRPMTLSRYITVGNNPPLFHDTILGEIALVMAAQEIILHLEREAFFGANEELA
jgi:hypothetical protein